MTQRADKNKKRLKLNPETVRNLVAPYDLTAVVGGMVMDSNTQCAYVSSCHHVVCGAAI